MKRAINIDTNLSNENLSDENLNTALILPDLPSDVHEHIVSYCDMPSLNTATNLVSKEWHLYTLLTKFAHYFPSLPHDLDSIKKLFVSYFPYLSLPDDLNSIKGLMVGEYDRYNAMFPDTPMDTVLNALIGNAVPSYNRDEVYFPKQAERFALMVANGHTLPAQIKDSLIQPTLELGLKFAIQNGYMPVFEHLIDSESLDKNNKSKALPWAAEYGRLLFVEYLLNKKIGSPFEAIKKAFEHGHLDIIRVLFAKLELFEKHKSTVLAAQYGQVEIFKETLALFPDMLDLFLRTAFWAACENGHLEIVNILLPQKGITLSDKVVGFINTLESTKNQENTRKVAIHLLKEYPEILKSAKANIQLLTEEEEKKEKMFNELQIVENSVFDLSSSTFTLAFDQTKEKEKNIVEMEVENAPRDEDAMEFRI